MPKTRSDKIAHPIAVVGMGCHYPGANQLSELWENILGQSLSISPVSRPTFTTLGIL
jgi:acyl transferase domain-containing protein